MEAALSMFSERGYEGSSTRDIAERAGVNEITLFRHFGNKENLFREVLSRQGATSLLTEELDERLSGCLREDLTFLAQRYLEVQYKNIDYIRIGVMEAPRNPAFANVIHVIPERLEAHLAEYMAKLAAQHVIRNRNFKLLARMFYGQLFHHVLMMCSFGDDVISLQNESSEMVDTLVSMFVQTLTIDDEKGMRSCTV